MKPRLEIHFTLREQIQFFFGKPYVPKAGEFLLNHSRSAIFLALQAANLPQGAKVGVMVYNCHTVMNVVDQAGYQLVFLDVDDTMRLDFENLKQKFLGLSVVIVTHLFGIENDIKAIRKEFPDLLIIEDCAHAYEKENLYGDFVTFSIGQGKLPSIGDGGILQVRNKRYMSSVAELYENIPDYSMLQRIMLYMGLLVKSWMHLRWIYGWFTLPLKQQRQVHSAKETLILLRMCRGISSIYAHEKDYINKKIEKRKQCAEKLLIDLHSEGDMCSMIGQNAFMLVVRCQDPLHLQQVLRRKGMDSATHFANAFVWAREYGYQVGSCPKAETMIKHVLMIPIY